MWGALIGAGASLLGGIFGGGAAARAAERQRLYLIRERKDNNQRDIENQNWYKRRVNEDYTQTAEAVNTMRQAREAAQEQINSARGAQAVQGGIGEVGKSAANKMLGNTYANIAAQGTAQKNAVESQYLQQKNAIAAERTAINDKLAGVEAQRAAAAANATGQIMKAGMSMVGSAVNNAFAGKNMFKDDNEN